MGIEAEDYDNMLIMRRSKILVYLILVTFCSLSYAQKSLNELEVSEPANALLMQHPKLKSTIFEYLDYFSCNDEKNQDFIGLYSLKSREYLNRFFPNIQSADEYKERMIARSEIYYVVYRSIESVELTSETEANVKVIFDSGNEGQIDRMSEIMYFKLEDGDWKFNASGSLEFIEVIEPF